MVSDPARFHWIWFPLNYNISVIDNGFGKIYLPRLMNRSQKIVILLSICLIILMCLFPPWNVYSRQRKSRRLENANDVSWGQFDQWDYWKSETSAVTGATPSYKFLLSAGVKRQENEQRRILREADVNRAVPFEFMEVEKKWALDFSRFVAQLGIVLIGTAILVAYFSHKTVLISINQNEKIWSEWGI